MCLIGMPTQPWSTILHDVRDSKGRASRLVNNQPACEHCPGNPVLLILQHEIPVWEEKMNLPFVAAMRYLFGGGKNEPPLLYWRSTS
jgi:hypothetical protein